LGYDRDTLVVLFAHESPHGESLYSQSDIQENPIPEEFDHLEKGRIGAGVRFQF
jgi:hypothetical protein